MVARAMELIEQECTVDFIDINMGCPIDIVVNKGAGSSLLTKPARLQNTIKAAAGTMEKPLTVKVRIGYFEGRNCVHSLIPDISKLGAAAITIHGQTRQRRYNKVADWDYIYQCARQAPDDLQVVGNGIFVVKVKLIFSIESTNKIAVGIDGTLFPFIRGEILVRISFYSNKQRESGSQRPESLN